MTPLDRLAAYIAGLHPKWRDTPWDTMDEATRELFREDARGALATIRVPKGAMIAAGGRLSHFAKGDDPNLEVLRNLNAIAIYTAMIDAATSAHRLTQGGSDECVRSSG